MCFSKEASIITTFLVYSAAIYSIVNNYHKSKFEIIRLTIYIAIAISFFYFMQTKLRISSSRKRMKINLKGKKIPIAL